LELDDNTIIVLWGDHGYHLGEQDLWHKHSNFELTTRVPLIVKVPGSKPQRIGGMVELLDVYPTLAELANLALISQVSGKSLATQLSHPGSPYVGRPAFSQYFRPYNAI